MIIAIAIILYVIIGLAVGRYNAVRRMKNGNWKDSWGDIGDSACSCIFASLFWPLALMHFFFAMPPKQTKLERKRQEIDKLERELGLK